MNTGGYIFMGVAWTAIIGLTFYCMFKIFTIEKKDSNGTQD
ncbi:hypothetical protein ABRY23_13985 [Melioribacteraceae bacterium 4301-Me]